MSEFRFTKLQVFNDAKSLHRDVVRATKSFPVDFYYLKDQTRRCALSCVLNIAEGSGKESDRDFNRYIQNALGSINELAACIEVAADEQLIATDTAAELTSRAQQLKDKLGALSRTLKS